jgi:hypothetical protein
VTRGLVTAIVLCLLVGGVGQVAGAPAGTTALSNGAPPSAAGVDGITGKSTGYEETPAVTQNLTYYLTPNAPGTIQVRFTYTLADSVGALVHYDSDRATVVSADGFSPQPNGRWKWDGVTERPTLLLNVSVNRTSNRFSGLNWVDAGSWALASPKRTFAYNEVDGSWRVSTSGAASVERQKTVASSGYPGSTMVFLGEYRTVSDDSGPQGLTMVIPEESEPTARPERVLQTVAEAGTQLRVGERDGNVTLFVGPSPLRNGGLSTGDGRTKTDNIWVHETRPNGAPANLWVHEYVHARQNVTLGQRMKWFFEGSASYYAGLLSVRQNLSGREGFEGFVKRLHRSKHAEATLSDRSTWPSSTTPYSKGQRVLAALDAEIRNRTDDEKTLQDVFRRMNAQEGTITYEDFARMLERVTGTSFTDWLERYVASPGSPEAPVDPYAYVPPNASVDVDEDGLSTDAERNATTHPFDHDTDDDGREDGAELTERKTDPILRDTDGDGEAEQSNQTYTTDPLEADTDGDGLKDGTEVEIGTNPTVNDTDGDTLSDSAEYEGESDPLVADTDSDGLDDGTEAALGTDPTDEDSDDDGFIDSADARIPQPYTIIRLS